MGEGKKNKKAERRQAKAGGESEAAPKKRAKAGRRKAKATAAGNAGAELDPAEIDTRLSRIEDAVAAQAERSQELLAKIDEMLAAAGSDSPDSAE